MRWEEFYSHLISTKVRASFSVFCAQNMGVGWGSLTEWNAKWHLFAGGWTQKNVLIAKRVLFAINVEGWKKEVGRVIRWKNTSRIKHHMELGKWGSWLLPKVLFYYFQTLASSQPFSSSFRTTTSAVDRFSPMICWMNLPPSLLVGRGGGAEEGNVKLCVAVLG